MLCVHSICERKFYARTHVKLRDTGNSRNFYVRTRVKLKQRQYMMVARKRELNLRTTFTFTRDTSYITSILFTCVFHVYNYGKVEINH